MGPLRKSVERSRFNETETVHVSGGVEPDAPLAQDQDWDSLEGAPIEPDSVAVDGDLGIDGEIEPGVEADGELPEEDDDNPDQDSDEALPDDDEERAIRRDMAGQGIRYKPE